MSHLSLRAKSLAALALACLVVLALAAVLGWQGTERVRAYFGEAYASNLTLLNRQKILAPIALDLALSRRLAASVVTRRWLLDEDDPDKRARFFEEAEGYRAALHDRAYFIASATSGNYYFNDSSAAVDTAPRYTLHADDPADAWFYASLANPADYRININLDDKLKLTRVWINALVRDGSHVLGIAGASVDLSEFLADFTGRAEPGVTPLIVDGTGAIQAHPDASRIVFNAAVGGSDSLHTVFDLMPAHDAGRMRAAMQQARAAGSGVQSAFLTLDGVRQIVALAYVPELDWYVVTGVDLSAADVIGTRWLWPALAGVVLLLVVLLLAFGYAVERMVLAPIRQLQQSARAIAAGSYDTRLPAAGRDEIGDLSRTFGEMAAKVRNHTAELENRVRERTTELEAANRAMAVAQKKIGDSIDYASLIQRAILPDRQLTQSLGAHHFVLWRPRDVVGGDFYVFRGDGENCLLGIMDCAGHGVPGALMTMLARAAVDVAIHEAGVTDPAAVLQRTDSAMRAMLADAHLPRALATNTDAGLVYIDRRQRRLLYAGARIALYASDGGQVHQYHGARRSLGDKRIGLYTNIELPLTRGWTFYLVTDGFLDQAGGDKGYGFGDARFTAMLQQHAARPLAEQAEAFTNILAAYQGDRPQRDDITLLSFRFEPCTTP